MRRAILALLLGALPALAHAEWDHSLVQGPWPVPTYGAPDATGAKPITGKQALYCIVVPTDMVPAALSGSARAVPEGVPVIAGVPSTALCRAAPNGDLDAAAEDFLSKRPQLQRYWRNLTDTTP